MRKIVVTPAGRERYLEVLFKHLQAQKQDFDEWWLLMNTECVQDIRFCERLAARHDGWISTKYADDSDPSKGNMNIHKLLNQFCRESDTVYLRLDDDISYLCPEFVKKMIDFRLAHPQYFLTYGNIVNNAILTWVYSKMGSLCLSQPVTYDCICEKGWKDPEVAEEIHREFLKNPMDPKWKPFDVWIATQFERISVNAICWTGETLQSCPVDPDEERWLSVARPKELGMPNAVCGEAVCVHFSFHTQRKHLDSAGLLERYAEINMPPPRA